MHFAAGSKFQSYELSLWLTGQGFALLEKSPACRQLDRKFVDTNSRLVESSYFSSGEPFGA
jgi:hypothetical protein